MTYIVHGIADSPLDDLGVEELSEDADGTSMTAYSRGESSSCTPVSRPIRLARNELLFRFGIVLLELGYSQLWPQLRRRIHTALPPQKNSDYHAAEKIAQTPLSRERWFTVRFWRVLHEYTDEHITMLVDSIERAVIPEVRTVFGMNAPNHEHFLEIFPS